MAANARAVAKLKDTRSGALEDEPAGVNPFEIFAGIMFGVWILVPPVILVTLSLSGLARIHPVPAIGVSVASSALAAFLAWRFYRDETGTPFKAVRYFFASALSGRHGHAYDMLIEADKDDTPRRVNGREFSFSGVDGFRDYWESVRAAGGGPGRVLFDAHHEVTMLDDDLALVKFALLDEGGKRGRDMRKLTVRVGDEWHLFNGEWSSSEDDDTSWTSQASPHSPALSSI